MRRDRWSLPLLAREALANTAGPSARGLPLLATAILLGIAGPAFGAVESVALQNSLQHEALLGRNLLVISSSDPDRPATIDRTSCEALAHDGDVARAGLLEITLSADLPQVGADVPLYNASATLFPALQHHAAVIGAALRRPGPAIDLLTPTGVLPSAVVGPRQPEAIGTDGGVVVALPPTVTTTDSCTVVLRPTADARTAQPRLIAELRHEGPSLTVPNPFREPTDPTTAYLARATQYLPYLLAAAGGAAAGVVTRLRTGEWAAYRLTGTAPRSMLILILLEQALLAATMTAAGALTVLALASRLTSPTGQLLDEIAAGALWILTASTIPASLAGKAPTLLAKE